MYTHIYKCTDAHTYTCIHAHTYTFTLAHTYTGTHEYIHTRSHIYRHTRIHIHTYICHGKIAQDQHMVSSGLFDWLQIFVAEGPVQRMPATAIENYVFSVIMLDNFAIGIAPSRY